MHEVDYDQLADSYAANLNSMLRGFNSGQEFLDLWVHDDDDTLSLANMIESAGAFSVKSLQIHLSNQRLNRVDLPKLQALLPPTAQLHVRKGNQRPTIEVALS